MDYTKEQIETMEVLEAIEKCAEVFKLELPIGNGGTILLLEYLQKQKKQEEDFSIHIETSLTEEGSVKYWVDLWKDGTEANLKCFIFESTNLYEAICKVALKYHFGFED